MNILLQWVNGVCCATSGFIRVLPHLCSVCSHKYLQWLEGMNLGPLDKTQVPYFGLNENSRHFYVGLQMRGLFTTVQVTGMIPLGGGGGAAPRFVQRTQLIAQSYQVI